MTDRAEILKTTLDIVTGDRNRTHGEPVHNMGHIAELWSAYLGIPITRVDVTHMMQHVKQSRYKHGAYNPDDFLDNVGYGAIAGECAAFESTGLHFKSEET